MRVVILPLVTAHCAKSIARCASGLIRRSALDARQRLRRCNPALGWVIGSGWIANSVVRRALDDQRSSRSRTLARRRMTTRRSWSRSSSRRAPRRFASIRTHLGSRAAVHRHFRGGDGDWIGCVACSDPTIKSRIRSPMGTPRSAASTPSCVIMSCVSGNSVVRASPRYRMLIANRATSAAFAG